MVGGSAGLKSAVRLTDTHESETVSLSLDVEPFDLQQTLDGGQAFRWYGTGHGVFRGVLGPRVVTIERDGTTVSVNRTSGIDCEALRRDIEDYLVTTADVTGLRALLSDEPGFGRDIAELPLIRVMRQDPWECLVGFICSQNSNIPRIKQMVAAVARMGRRIGSQDWAFELPNPNVIADAGETYLREVGLGYRAKHLASTAKMLANSSDIGALRDTSYYDAKEALMELPGVGPKVADCVLAYSLDKGEAFPVDVHVRRAAIRLYGLDEDIKNDAVGEWARDRFGKYAAWAQLYMFRDEINRRLNGA
ncbi:MAG: hypothetical protein F4Y63_03025 [Chloroflexi bacterium]|nr:hypothetical protein [Chloroflexota bacterium]MYK61616.1 hypothetical protein [Chloroflexota bacterium]